MIQMTDEEYVNCDGSNCPYCASENLSGSDFDMDGGKVFLFLTCNTCGATWDDVYSLTGYMTRTGPTRDPDNLHLADLNEGDTVRCKELNVILTVKQISFHQITFTNPGKYEVVLAIPLPNDTLTFEVLEDE